MKHSLYAAIVLDRSGSMQSVKDATISGFNEFLNDQKKSSEPQDRLLLTQFSDKYELVYDMPIAVAPELCQHTYRPGGMTALFDAMGKTIADLGSKLAAIPEAERPGRVLVATITDGFENSSREFNHKAVADLIEHQRTKYSWGFLFIGANQDAILTAKSLNLPQSNALYYTPSVRGVGQTFGAMSRFYSGYGSVSDPLAMAFTEEDRALAASS